MIRAVDDIAGYIAERGDADRQHWPPDSPRGISDITDQWENRERRPDERDGSHLAQHMQCEHGQTCWHRRERHGARQRELDDDERPGHGVGGRLHDQLDDDRGQTGDRGEIHAFAPADIVRSVAKRSGRSASRMMHDPP